MDRSLLRWALVLAIPLTATGCGADDSLPNEPERIAVAEQAARIVLNSWTDWSGLVRVTLYACDWSAKVAHPEARCVVPDDDIIVGGGAEIEGDGDPGALLTASYPMNAREWAVASKDHVRSFPHRIRARALGLRLSGVSAFDLETLVHIRSQTAAGGSNTSIVENRLSSSNCADCLMVGGGARAQYAGSGHLLYESQGVPDVFTEPDGTLHPDVWLASSKAHSTSDTSGRVTSYLIAIPRCPPGFTGGCLTNARQIDQIANTTTGYRVLTSAVGQFWGYALTTVGGFAIHDGAGRMLTDLYPYFSDPSRSPAGRATSKDHIIADSSRSTLITLFGLATER